MEKKQPPSASGGGDVTGPVKLTEEDMTSMSPLSSDLNGHTAAGNVDAALSYARVAKAVDTSSVDETTLLKKIDWKLVPVMFACYTMQFVDKVNINV